jgi:hypothetical protein
MNNESSTGDWTVKLHFALHRPKNSVRKRDKKINLEITGFEPVASRMQSERSTTELNPPDI